MSHDSLVTKPASGHWTDAYPELGRGPVSLEDCVSEEFYDKEREHVFKKTWLYLGRVERVPKSGSYFTRELKFLNTSVIIVRGKDDVIRAFHNICPHRATRCCGRTTPSRRSRVARHFCTAASMAGVTSWMARCIRPPARICCSTSTPTAAGCLRSNARCGKASSSSTSTRTTRSRYAPSSANWHTASRAIPSRGHTRSIGSRPNCSATGRSSSTASRRATTDRICTRRRSAISPRRPKRRWTSRTRLPTRWPISSRVRIGCSRSRVSHPRKRRTRSRWSA